MEVIVIETRQLGDRSYLVHDGSVALAIDPQRDTDRIEAAARDAGVAITHVAETHLHNDYITGGLILARAHGASYLVNAADAVAFERTPVERPAHRWVVVPDAIQSRPDSQTAVEREGQEPAA